jgi:hypothetical protein
LCISTTIRVFVILRVIGILLAGLACKGFERKRGGDCPQQELKPGNIRAAKIGLHEVPGNKRAACGDLEQEAGTANMAQKKTKVFVFR